MDSVQVRQLKHNAGSVHLQLFLAPGMKPLHIIRGGDYASMDISISIGVHMVLCWCQLRYQLGYWKPTGDSQQVCLVCC